MEAEDRARLALDHLLGVRLAEKREHRSRGAGGGLDHMRHKTLFGLIIEIAEIFAAVLHVLFEVVIAAMGDSFKLAPAPREFVFDVAGADGIERQFFLAMLAQTQIVSLEAEILIPLEALITPLRIPLLAGFRFAEKLDLHLLELARAEDELFGRNLITETLAHLRDAERNFHARGIADVLKVDEDSLCRLGAQVDLRRAFFNGADEGLEHQVELAGFSKLAFRKLSRLLRRLLGALTLGDLVLAKTCLAGFAVHQRVREVRFMPGRNPNRAMHQNGGIESDDIVARGDIVTPPGVLDIAEQFHAQRPIIPRAIKAA